MTSKDVVFDAEKDGNLPAVITEKAGGLSYEEYVKVVSGQMELPESTVTAADIAFSILNASSLEEGLGEQKAEGLRDYIGREIIVHDFKLNESDDAFKAQGAPVYAVIDATDTGTGERVVLTTGSVGVLAALGLMLKLGTFDETFFVKGVDTPNGKALKLVYRPGAKPFGD